MKTEEILKRQKENGKPDGDKIGRYDKVPNFRGAFPQVCATCSNGYWNAHRSCGHQYIYICSLIDLHLDSENDEEWVHTCDVWEPDR